ncbi:MAG: RES family NAD+ phosphorylase [Proteobacteria bacterium]|nr:RES family NAD+ phosphorylase [Pseudomonadota bacterium]
MIIAWRLVKKKRARDAFSGEGARRYGGRWNHPGTSVVYVADSLALAALEQFVHLGRAHAAFSFVFFRVQIPNELVASIPKKELPKNWREEPPTEDTMRIGTEWVSDNLSAVLRVPSTIVPIESNLVLSTSHANFSEIHWSKPKPFTFDPRLWK